MPLISKTEPKSCICYMVGCNAWGQASLSAAAALATPLGLPEMTESEQRTADLFQSAAFQHALNQALIEQNQMTLTQWFHHAVDLKSS